MNIPFSPPDISELEVEEVAEALRSGWITTGPRVKLLERRLAAYIDTGKTDIDCNTEENIAKYSNRVVCLNSATAAEELNFRICGIGEGDEVIVPAYTYTATASAAIHCGAKVIFVDSQKDSTEMDYDKVAEAITEKTKAIVAVDLGGIVADYDKLYQVVEAKKNIFKAKTGDSLGARIQQASGRVLVFSDCAHGLGASRNGKMTGEIADFTSFSFHAVKNFTTGEGGAAAWREIPGVDNSEIYKQYQLYSLHGQSKDALAKTQLGAWEYDIVGPWYKCNMTDIMAAIGLRQLDRYEGLLARRKEIIGKYDEMCNELGVMHIGFGGAFDHFIHAFHMPMFFFISGFFYWRRECSIGEYVGKKAKSLLIPYISFGIAHYFVDIILHGFYINPLINLLSLNTVSLPIAGALWFLTALFFTDVFYFLLDRWNTKWLIIPLVLIGSFADQMLPYPLPWALSASLVGLGLYWFGEMSKKYEDKLEKLLNMNWWRILVVGAVTTVLIFVNGYINMREGRYAFVPLFWINALLSVYVGISISKMICRTEKIKWLTRIGRNSIVYVCLNQIVLMVLKKVFSYLQMSTLVSHLIILVACLFILLWLAELFTRPKLKMFIGRFD